MKCERCDKELREAGVMATLDLKALGLYPSDTMTLQGDKRTMTIVAGGGSAVVPQAFAELGTAQLTFTQDQPFQPASLHRLPGRPINAYPLIKDVNVIVRITAGTLVTPIVLVGFLKFRDNQSRDHIVCALGISAPSAFVPTDNSLQAPISRGGDQPLIIGAQLGESPIALFGTWVIEGYLTLGTATQVEIDIFANLGVLYGAPNT